MTPLQVKCVSCQADLRLPSNFKPGIKLRCPRCKAQFALPEPPSLEQTQDSAANSGHATVGTPSDDSDGLSFLAPPQQPDELGRLGGYRVLRELGRGGMGVVLQAEDTQLKRMVALKVMLPHVAAKPAHLQRFLREAQAAAKLEHDHVVTIHTVGEERGVPFIAMPFLKGESLDSCLLREGPLPWKEVVRIGRETAEALQAAHEAGLIHRDIKPSNLWLEGSRRRVKVLDFGLARLQTSDVQLTNSGTVLGTPAYMSPEQARGDELDGRADLFSLGCVLYRAATGRVAISGDQIMAVLMAIATHHPPTLDQLRADAPPALTALVTRLLAKDRDARPASAAEVAQELAAIEHLLRDSDSVTHALATTSPPPKTDEETASALVRPEAPPQRPRRRLPVALGAGGLALALLAGIVIILTNKDGSKTTIELPDDTRVEVKKDGKTVVVHDPKKNEPVKDRVVKDGPGKEVPKNPPPKDDPIDFAAERKAAEKLLALKKGRIDLLDASGQNVVGSITGPDSKLPDGNFYVARAHLLDVDLTDEELALLGGCSRLEMLHIGGGGNAKLTDAGIRALGNLKRLRDVNIAHSAGIGDVAAELIARNPLLELVGMHGANKITDATVRALVHCPRLRTFDPPPSATDAALTEVVAKCRELRHIDLHQCHRLTLKPLATLPRLRWVHCCGDHLTAEGVGHLAALPYLDTLAVAPPSPEGLVERLKPLAGKVRVLAFSSFFDWDQGIPAAAWETVLSFPHLEELAVTGQKHVVDAAFLRKAASMRDLRQLRVAPIPAGQKYTEADVAEFRRRRPDVALTVKVGEKTQEYPPLVAWPGKDEGDGSLAPWPKDTPPPAVVPFSAEQAKKHQEAWAAHLKLPVEETSKATGMKFRLIPPGDMLTGADDVPQKTMTRIATPYYLGTTEVTVGQFKKFVEATGYRTDAERFGVGRNRDKGWTADPAITWRTPGYAIADDLPVTVISVPDANAFLDWLGKQDGAVYRLPTQAEWEAACRAGGTGELAFIGSGDKLAEYAWESENVQGKPTWVQPVGTLKSNPFGLFDVLGNVWEWYHPEGGGGGVRGNSFVESQNQKQVSAHVSGTIHINPNVGFRVLRQTTKERLPEPKFGEGTVRVGRRQPLSAQATVSRPAAIPGVRSWSVELAGHRGSVSSIAWSPKGDLLATAGYHDTSVRLWDRAGNLQAILLGHAGSVSGVSFSADGTLLASCDFWVESTLRVWEVATGRCRLVLPLNIWVPQVVFAPVGRKVAVSGSGGNDTNLILDLDTGTSIPLDARAWNSGPTWSPDGKFLLTQAGRVHDAATGRTVGELSAPDWPEGKPQWGGQVAWSPDGKWLAAGCADGKLRLWEAATRKFIRSVPFDPPGGMAGVCWLPDSRRMVVNKDGYGHALVDTVEGKIVTKLAAANASCPDLAIGPQGVVATASSQPMFCDPAKDREFRTGPLRGHGTAMGLLVSDGRKVTSKMWYWRTRRDFDAETGRLLGAPNAPGGHLVALAPGGQWYAYLTSEREVQVIHADGATVKLELPAEIQGGWRPDPAGRRLAGILGKQVIVWDVATGKKQLALDHPETIPSHAFHSHLNAGLSWSPDGTRLATAAKDKIVRLWDTTDGKLLRSFDRFPQPLEGMDNIISLGWEPDGIHLWVSLGGFGARLDTATGRVFPPENLTRGNLVNQIVPAPDGHQMLAQDGSGWTFLRTTAFGLDSREGRWLPDWELGEPVTWLPDARRFLGRNDRFGVRGYDTRRNQRLGTLWPEVSGGNWICIGPDGHWRGSEGVESQIVIVAMLEDGSQKTYSPAAFEKAFGWKNDPTKARLLALDPPAQK